MSAENLRIGFIGCGGIAQGHLQSLANNPNARVVAACDVNEAAAQKAAALSDAKVYTDYKQLLAQEQLDAVYLCTPPFVHGDVEFAIIERDLPFFVQKPVALTLELANRIAAAVSEKNLMTCVGYQLRYFGAANIAREVLSGKQIGLVAGTYWCGSGRSTAIPPWWLWREKSGGQLVEQATHVVDTMRYLAGEIDEVFCWESRTLLDRSKTDCADVTSVSFRFRNGAVGALTCTMALEASDWARANMIDIIYSDRRLRWAIDGVTLTHGAHEEAKSAENLSIDDAFVEAVRTGNRSLIHSDYEEGLRTLAITLAAEESFKRGQPVRVDKFIAQHRQQL